MKPLLITLLAALIAACAPRETATDGQPQPQPAPRSPEQRSIQEHIERALAADHFRSEEALAFGRAHMNKVVSLEVEVDAPLGDNPYQSGSAVLVGTDGTMLTAWHVIDGANRIRASLVRWREDASVGQHRYEKVETFDVVVVKSAQVHDVALLRPIEGTELDDLPAPAVIRTTRPELEERVYHLGMRTDTSAGTLTNRSAELQVQQTRISDVIAATVLTLPGDSGGPLFDARGQLIGICIATTQWGSIGFFAPMDTALPALQYRQQHD